MHEHYLFCQLCPLQNLSCVMPLEAISSCFLNTTYCSVSISWYQTMHEWFKPYYGIKLSLLGHKPVFPSMSWQNITSTVCIIRMGRAVLLNQCTYLGVLCLGLRCHSPLFNRASKCTDKGMSAEWDENKMLIHKM